MKKQLITIAVALLTAGTLITSCSSEDNIIETPQTQQPAGNTITLTATLAPKGDNGGTTRAITTGKDGENKEILNVAWAADEEISIYYQTASGYAKTTATVQSVDATTGAATIVASLDANTTDGGTVKFEIDPFRKHCLINGLDDIGLTMEKKTAIDSYEEKLKTERAWA